MKDKILMILLGIIAVNLTIQTVKDVGIFPTAYAQSGVQKIAICDDEGVVCASIDENGRYGNQLMIDN
tara:strand:- start:353 stop:556 length:204 start_codon:yes stop_codon:yes gene_type:complete